MIKQWALTIWQWIDPLYYACTRLQYVARDGHNIFRVRLLRYRGRALQLTDGNTIVAGDLLVKIHLHNVRLLHLLLMYEHPLLRSRKLYQLVQTSLPGLAAFVLHHPRASEIRGIIGVTQLNRGCRQLGFDVCEIDHQVYRRWKRIALLPIYLLSVQQPWQSMQKHQPKLLLMSRSQLLQHYFHTTCPTHSVP